MMTDIERIALNFYNACMQAQYDSEGRCCKQKAFDAVISYLGREYFNAISGKSWPHDVLRVLKITPDDEALPGPMALFEPHDKNLENYHQAPYTMVKEIKNEKGETDYVLHDRYELRAGWFSRKRNGRLAVFYDIVRGKNHIEEVKELFANTNNPEELSKGLYKLVREFSRLALPSPDNGDN